MGEQLNQSGWPLGFPSALRSVKFFNTVDHIKKLVLIYFSVSYIQGFSLLTGINQKGITSKQNNQAEIKYKGVRNGRGRGTFEFGVQDSDYVLKEKSYYFTQEKCISRQSDTQNI